MHAHLLHPAPPAFPWRRRATARLPGTHPISGTQWLVLDALRQAHLQERRRLIAERRADVIALDPVARPAAQELLDRVLTHLAADHGVTVRADRIEDAHGDVAIDHEDPLGTLGHLVQEDFCLLVKSGLEHLLRGAVLCFPSGWTLREKMGLPLGAIHAPVDSYTPEMARRVQRLMDHVTWERPLMRANAHTYEVAPLFDAWREADKPRPKGGRAAFLRVERQVLRRLPETGAVAFSIHTSITRLSDLTAEDRAALQAQTAP